MQTLKLAQKKMASPIGDLLLCADDDALMVLEFADAEQHVASQSEKLGRFIKRENIELLEKSNAILEETEKQLEEYFRKKRRFFNLPLKLPGTAFQQKVWQALQQIPYGETRSYRQQAELIGQPTATRAVANANGKNRIAIIVPCHRIIAADGNIGGYTGGLDKKRKLLAIEDSFLQ